MPYPAALRERESVVPAVGGECEMSRQKSFKVRVRARVDRTGESYATARRRLLEKANSAVEQAAKAEARAVSAAGAADPPAEGQAGSEATVRERTGRGWEEWFALLDGWGAAERSRAEIIGWLGAEHRVGDWWAQCVTVGYERARGLRMPAGDAPDPAP